MSVDPSQAKAIFLEAVEKHDPDQWPGFLNRACAGQPDLRGHVEALLKAHREAGTVGFQSSVEGGPVPPRAHLGVDVEHPGAVIGPYKLLEQIGEGGFGVVFLAEQSQPVRRKVALKVLKPGMDTRSVVARFEAERQALALMDHPNIAKVFDGGQTPPAYAGGSPRPYFVMELVKGVPITDFCDQNHLTPRQRLELFLPVCQAVQHAHHKGIIHRDLKPNNVLVSRHDTTPVVKVIDFGVAKALGQELTDKTLFTGIAQMIGTPLYMSPEQAGMSDLDVDTRSDIYSLGVLLYELLTGTTPFDKERFKKAAYDEIRRIIREEEPPKPSTRLSESKDSLPSISAQRQTEPAKLTKLVRGELDWIVMKALEKDRNRRYETANGFAMDVQRYLADEPVQACPPSVAYRFRKFVRRNKGPVLAASLVFLALLGGIIGTSLGLIESRRQEGLAVAAQLKEAARAEAEARQRRVARKAVDEMYTQVAQKWLSQQPRMEKVQRDFLEKALRYYQEFVTEQSTDPAVQLETATAYRRMGAMYDRLGQSANATAAYGQAVKLTEKLAADFPAVREYREELANEYDSLARLQMYTDRTDDAQKSFGRALEVCERLVADFGADAALRQNLAGSHHGLGSVLTGMLGGTARPKEAVKAFRAAVELYRGLATDAPDVAEHQSHLGAALSDWGMMLVRDGELAEAGPLLKEAISRQQAALKLEPHQPTYRQFLINHLVGWADIAEGQGDHREAVTRAQQALALQAKLADDFPEIPHYRHAQAEYSYNLGRMLASTSASEAEAILRQAVSLLEKLADSFADVPERRGLLADCYSELGGLMAAAGRDADAAADFRAALKWEPKLPATLSALGRNLLKQQKFADAEPVLREGLKMREQKQPDTWMVFDTRSLLGGALLGQKKFAEAEPLLLAGYHGMKQREQTITEPDMVRLTEALERLVRLYEAWGQPEKAAEWRKKLATRVPAKKD